MEADRDLIRRFYLKHGFADVQVVSAVAEYDPAKKGFNITFTIEEGPLYHFGSVDVQSNVRAVDSAIAAVGPAHAPGRHLQRRGDRKDRRAGDHRGVAARLSVRLRAPARRPQSADPHHQRRLRRRRGHARLYRAHQYPRQYPHPRLRDPARVRHRRRRSVQPRAGRPRRAAAQEPELLQVGEDHQRARIGARPGGAQCRSRGAVDRRFLDHGRLFDGGRLACHRCRSPSATCSAPAATPRSP